MPSFLFQKQQKLSNLIFIKNFSISAGKPASIKSKYQILSDGEFNNLTSQVYRLNCSPLLQARIFVAYQLLRIYTIRASDLPSLTVGQMKNFQKTSILEIVNTRHSHGLRLHLNEEVRDCFFHICEPFLNVLYQGKIFNDPLLTGKNSLSKAISCTMFSSQLNKLLRSTYETISDSPIRTSSLRVGNCSFQGWIEASRSSHEIRQLFTETPEPNVLNGNTLATLKKSESLKKAGVLSVEHFGLLISWIYCPTRLQKLTLSQVRIIVAFHILRFRKLEISELSQITVGQIKEFLKSSVFEFQGGSYSSKKASVFLKGYLPFLEILFLGKDPNDPLFHGKSKKKKINTKVFCTELNAPLKNKDILCLGFPVKLSLFYDGDSFPSE